MEGFLSCFRALMQKLSITCCRTHQYTEFVAHLKKITYLVSQLSVSKTAINIRLSKKYARTFMNQKGFLQTFKNFLRHVLIFSTKFIFTLVSVIVPIFLTLKIIFSLFVYFSGKLLLFISPAMLF